MNMKAFNVKSYALVCVLEYYEKPGKQTLLPHNCFQIWRGGRRTMCIRAYLKGRKFDPPERPVALGSSWIVRRVWPLMLREIWVRLVQYVGVFTTASSPHPSKMSRVHGSGHVSFRRNCPNVFKCFKTLQDDWTSLPSPLPSIHLISLLATFCISGFTSLHSCFKGTFPKAACTT